MPSMERIEIDGAFLELAAIPAPPQARSDLAPLLFLHEGLDSVSIWRDWPAQLCTITGRAGWLYSRRGYGRSTPIADARGSGHLPPDYLHHEALDVLPQVLEHLDLASPVLVGHSDGATIALIYAVIPSPPASCWPRTCGSRTSPLLACAVPAKRFLMATCGQALERRHDDVDSAFWPWNDIWLNLDFHRFDIRHECRAIDTPLLAIQGEDDEYATMAQLDELARVAPQTEWLKLPACGHLPYRNQAEQANRVVCEFLKSV